MHVRFILICTQTNVHYVQFYLSACDTPIDRARWLGPPKKKSLHFKAITDTTQGLKCKSPIQCSLDIAIKVYKGQKIFGEPQSIIT